MGGQGSGGHNTLQAPFVPDAGVEMFERQACDTDKSWLAFTAYRDLGKKRSLMKTATFMDKKPGYATVMGEWSTKFGWRVRAQAWDAVEDAVARKARLEGLEQTNREMALVAESLWKLAAQDLARHHQRIQAADANVPVYSAKDLALLTETGMKLQRLLNGEATDRFGSDGTLEVQIMNFGPVQVKF